MKVLVKRFRITLYFLILFIICASLATIKGKYNEFFLLLSMFVCLPMIFISFIKSWILAIKDLINYSKGYAWPKDEPLKEVETVRKIVAAIKVEIDILKRLSITDRLIRMVLEAIGAGLLVLGIFLIIKMHLAWGIICLIVGMALWIIKYGSNKVKK